MILMGIDQAESHAGVYIYEYDYVTQKRKQIDAYVFEPISSLISLKFSQHLRHARNILKKHEPQCVALEGIAMGYIRNQPYNVGGIFAVYMSAFMTGEVAPYIIVVSPMKLKYFFTASGKSEKPTVRKAVIEKLGLPLPRDTNISDAAGLAYMAEVYCRLKLDANDKYGDSLKQHEMDIFVSKRKSRSNEKPAGIMQRPQEFYFEPSDYRSEEEGRYVK